MEKVFVKSLKGYDIPAYFAINGGERKAVIISHGFGSSKESPTAQMMLKALSQQGIAVVAYDFPEHGESKAPVGSLSLQNCIADMGEVEKAVKGRLPKAELGYFASSFGAYINLLYLSKGMGTGIKAFFRSAAVNMPEIFKGLTAEEEEKLQDQGYVVLPYARPLRVSKEFIEEMKAEDLFKVYKPGKARIQMIHGGKDETIDPDRAIEFAEKNHIPLIIVPEGGHRLSEPGNPEKVQKTAVKLFI